MNQDPIIGLDRVNRDKRPSLRDDEEITLLEAYREVGRFFDAYLPEGGQKNGESYQDAHERKIKNKIKKRGKKFFTQKIV